MRFLCSALVLLFSSVVWSGPDVTLPQPLAVPGEILVKFKEGMEPMEMATVYHLTGSQVIKQYPLIPGLHLIKAQGVDIQEMLSSFNQHPFIEYAEPNYIVSIGEFERAQDFP